MIAEAAVESPATVGFLGAVFVGWSLFALPFLAWRSKRQFDAGLVIEDRRAFFASIAIQQAVLGAFAGFVAWTEGIDVLPARWPAGAGWLAALVFVLVAAGTLPWRWARSTPERRARLLQLAPVGRGDLPPWFLLCVLAGFGEELAWRGVLPELLVRYGVQGDTPIVISAVGFALAHATQGLVSMLLIFVFALGFHGIVIASGCLYAAMVAHAVYDAIAGLVTIQLARRVRLASTPTS